MDDLLMTGMFPSMPGFGMSPGIDASLGLKDIPTQVGDKKFVDLLGLVSEMEIADTQVENAPSFLEKESEKALKSLRNESIGQNIWTGSEALLAQSEALKGSSLVGQELKLKNFSPETEEPIKMNSKLIGVVDQQQPIEERWMQGSVSPVRVTEQQDPESLALWTAAIQSNDIKSIEVHERTDPGMQAQKLENLKAGISRISLATKGVESSENLASVKSVQVPAAKDAMPLKAEIEKPVVGFERPLSAEPQVQKSSKDLPCAESMVSDDSPKVASHQKPSLSQKEFSMGQKSKSASDFMLARMGEKNDAVKVEKFESPFIQPELLASTSDKRISSEAINFVGQKVQDLKAIGGGELRIDLHPKDLGQLEIRVGMNRGKMEVTIEAEKSETLSALQNSSEQLKGKLEQIASSDLKLVAKGAERRDSAPEQGMKTQSVSSAPFARSSQDLMDMRLGSVGTKPSVVKAQVERAAPSAQAQSVDVSQLNTDEGTRPELVRNSNMEVQSSGESRSSEFSKEGKSDAWQKWEEYQRRKSA